MVYYIVLVLIIIALAFWVWKLYGDKKEGEQEVEAIKKESQEYKAIGQGLAEYNQKLQEKKNLAKEKILEMFSKTKKLSNKEIAKELLVSRDTVITYLDELEGEGKVKQIGKSGRNVFYSKI